MNDRMLEDPDFKKETQKYRDSIEQEIDDLHRAPIEIDWINPEYCLPKANEDCIFKVLLRGEHSDFNDNVFIVMSGYFCGETEQFKILNQTGYSDAIIPPNQVIGWRYIEVK